jgi:hypothetical protein
MRCPSCNQEAGLVVQDPDFESMELKGTTATLTVVEKQFCDQCSATVQEDKFVAVVEVPEAAQHPDGDEHIKDIHAEGLSGEDGEFEVKFRFVCSCGASVNHTGIAKSCENSTPWQNPA